MSDAERDLAKCYKYIKADRDGCRLLAEQQMEQNERAYEENLKLHDRIAELESSLEQARMANKLLARSEKRKIEHIGELESLIQDWCDLYEEPDYGDCIRLRKRMAELGIEVDE